MKKLKRLTEDQKGSGSGQMVLNHGPFQVVHWYLNNRSEQFHETELKIITNVRESSLRFDGHQPFKTLADCLAQLTNSQIMRLFKDLRESGVEEGKVRKAREVCRVLGIKG